MTNFHYNKETIEKSLGLKAKIPVTKTFPNPNSTDNAV
jgi:hypothetical protein